eukprot:GHVP01061811.1.p1 GENE.GHVP01061811.1~~GHVP01061811.1.p1  ORF type:complete len:441 (+),score=55.01 GHVP01061811.1:434-1756(+)
MIRKYANGRMREYFGLHHYTGEYSKSKMSGKLIGTQDRKVVISRDTIPGDVPLTDCYDRDGTLIPDVKFLLSDLHLVSKNFEIFLTRPVEVHMKPFKNVFIHPDNISCLQLKGELMGNVNSEIYVYPNGEIRADVKQTFSIPKGLYEAERSAQELEPLRRISAFTPYFHDANFTDENLWYYGGQFYFGHKAGNFSGSFKKMFRTKLKAPFTVHNFDNPSKFLTVGVASGPSLCDYEHFWDHIDRIYPNVKGKPRCIILLDNSDKKELEKLNLQHPKVCEMKSSHSGANRIHTFFIYPPQTGKHVPLCDKSGQELEVRGDVIYVTTDMDFVRLSQAKSWFTPGLFPDLREGRKVEDVIGLALEPGRLLYLKDSIFASFNQWNRPVFPGNGWEATGERLLREKSGPARRVVKELFIALICLSCALLSYNWYIRVNKTKKDSK